MDLDPMLSLRFQLVKINYLIPVNVETKKSRNNILFQIIAII